jgi:hypothetical protein
MPVGEIRAAMSAFGYHTAALVAKAAKQNFESKFYVKMLQTVQERFWT